jgi:hypothetical protein
MNDSLKEDPQDHQIFLYEASDEALEATADAGNGTLPNFTYHSCTHTPYCAG